MKEVTQLLLVGLLGCSDVEQPPAGCTFPEPQLTLVELASHPDRCGQPAYTWVDDPSLGSVTARQNIALIEAGVLELALAIYVPDFPYPPEHDIILDQITYTTQDRGVLVGATAAVAYRADGFADQGPRDIVLMLHGSAGTTDACSPSSGGATQALTAAFASWGYVVVAPDYLGLRGDGEPTGFLHPLLLGQSTAIASLDAVRALSRLTVDERGGTCVAPRVLVVGGSQGGHAALWIDRLAPYYAPELELGGMVATVPPVELLAETELAIASKLPATNDIVKVFVTASGWYGVEDRLGEALLEPLASTLVPLLGDSCGLTLPLPATTAEIFQPAILTAVGNGSFGDLEPWGCFFRENGLPTTSIARLGGDSDSYGVLVVFGEADVLVHPAIEKAAVQGLCEGGLPVRVLECLGADHFSGTYWALPEIFDFVAERAAGVPFARPASCEPDAAVTCRGTSAR